MTRSREFPANTESAPFGLDALLGCAACGPQQLVVGGDYIAAKARHAGTGRALDTEALSGHVGAFRPMETTGRQMAPEATIVPLLEEDELRMHGDNERTPVASLGCSAEYLFRTLATVRLANRLGGFVTTIAITSSGLHEKRALFPQQPERL